ncbi:MAG: hypothetical protein JKY45_12870 [Emcibacter sp.]|nr:hypothetical protein [Emcibacter sp.]
MLNIFKQPPFVGIIAFMAVLFVQPLGHISMILMEKFFVGGERWYSPVFDTPPVIPEGFEDFSIMENNIYWSAFVLGALGLAIIIWGIRRNTEIAGTWAGFVGGCLVWTGWVEFSIHFHARYFGVKALCAPGQWAYACAENPSTKPEYFLMQGSVGFMLAIGFFFLFNKETRCNAFRWVQRNFHLNVGKPSPGLTRNFANIVAAETIGILWFFYVYLMFVYDETLFGEKHWFTYASFIGFGLWSLYLIQRLIRFRRVTIALRYAIPTAIIFWNTIEIMGRWNWFKEFWIHPMDYKLASVSVTVGVVAFAVISIMTARKKENQID